MMSDVTHQSMKDTADLMTGMAQKLRSKDLTHEELCQIQDKLKFVMDCVEAAKFLVSN